MMATICQGRRRLVPLRESLRDERELEVELLEEREAVECERECDADD